MWSPVVRLQRLSPEDPPPSDAERRFLSEVFPMQKLMRHIEACRNAILPGDREALLVGNVQVGWVKPDLGRRLASCVSATRADGGVSVTAAALPGIARDLATEGCFRWRDEAFDVRGPDDAVCAQVDRGALPAFGIQACGAHLNGLVHRSDALHLWVGRRADDRPLDPGKLDNLAAGGIPAGLSPRETLLKEAQEEAGLDPALTAQARPVAEIVYAMEREEGLRRDRLFCFDLMLPEDFVPHPQDDEIVGFELWPLAKVIERVAETDDFKFNVNLVLIDLFLRHGLDDPGDRLRRALSEALKP